MKKKVFIAFLGNALHDSRITNLKDSLEADGCEVKVISFDWTTPNFKTIINDITIYKLNKSKISFLFYFSFAVKLWKSLKLSNADIYIAEDFFPLAFTTIIGRRKNSKVIYNSRELYPFLGGLRNKKFTQWLIKKIEKKYIKKVDLVLTTGEMDSKFLEDYYGIKNTMVLRNIPLLRKPGNKIDLRKILNIPSSNKIVLYQGVMIEGRGIIRIISLLKELPNIEFVLLGDGALRKEFERAASKYNVHKRVHFLGTIPQRELINYTAAADIGLALIENISVSYYHALPNKLFEYIMAGIPVFSSNLPQMEKIVNDYQVGIIVDEKDDSQILTGLKKLTEDEDFNSRLKENCAKASLELNWDKEYSRVKDRLLS
ncbi:MAG: glycosyltransferase [Melioribacteraceae bacterium]|nr:glycosyltransferase [Melioribacteraceae bacterium]